MGSDSRRRPSIRHGAQRVGALGAACLLVAIAIPPITLAAHPAPPPWKASSHGRPVPATRVGSVAGAARAAAASPRATGAVSLRTPSSRFPATTNPVPNSTREAPAPRITIPDLVAVTQFGGLRQSESGGLYPADPWVGVNASFVVQTVNSAVRVSTRSGSEILTVPQSAMFAVPPGQIASDTRLIWDAVHGRWVAEVLSFKDDFTFTQNYLIVAVSDGADPTAGWTIYQFSFVNELPDYPSLASSGDKIVVASNLFDNGGTFLAADIITITWSSILGGANLAVFECTNPSALNPRAAQVLSAGNDVHLVSEAFSDGSQLYDRITGSGNCDTGQFRDATDMSATLGWSPFTAAPAPRQPGPDTIANAFDERPTDALWMAGKLWWVSTYPVSYDLGATWNDEVVLWGANTPTSGAPTFNTFYEIQPGDAIDAYMGGIGMSRNGTLFVAYTQSSDSTGLSLWANRVPAGGSLGSPQLLDSSDYATIQERWGDYVGIATDPVGTGAVWATHMLTASDGTWRTDVARLLVDGDSPTNPGAPVVNALLSKSLTDGPAYRIAWTASTDGSSGTLTYKVEESVDGGAYGAPTWVKSLSVIRSLSVGHTHRFRVSAYDPLGHASGTVVGSLVQPIIYQSPSSKAGTWHTTSASVYAGGSTWYASALGASATFTTTGVRSIGFVTTKSPYRGKFRVYIDGVLKATLDAHTTSATSYRQLVYQFTWATPGTHTIKIYVLGTAGHPRVDVDAFLVLK